MLTGISWIDIQLMLSDMSYYDYKATADVTEKEGTIEDLQNKFAKYIQHE